MQTMRFPVAVVLAAFAIQAHSASFDCAKAATRVERAICAAPDLGKLDEAIAAAYGAAAIDLDEAMRQRLARAQREWLKQRRAPPALAPDMQQRLAQLRTTRVTIDGVAFLQLAGESRPMYVLGAAAGAAAYNRWVDTVWEANSHDTSPRDADVQRARCVAEAPAGQQDDCIVESQAHVYRTSVLAPAIVSVYEWRSLDQGAAHPENETHHDNWWLSRSGPVTVADMFAGDAYKTVIAQATRRFVQRDGGKATQEAIDSVTDPDAWGLSSKGMTLTGDGYVFSHGRGVVDIDVPWRDFGTALRPGFTAALNLK
jgi:uncharacterized protein